MGNPQLVRDMVLAAKQRCGSSFSVSVKIRIHPRLEETEEFVRIIETSGVDYIVVHGRTRGTRSSTPANTHAIKRVRRAATVPVVANGDVFTVEDVTRVAKTTEANGSSLLYMYMVVPAIRTSHLQLTTDRFRGNGR